MRHPRWCRLRVQSGKPRAPVSTAPAAHRTPGRRLEEDEMSFIVTVTIVIIIIITILLLIIIIIIIITT